MFKHVVKIIWPTNLEDLLRGCDRIAVDGNHVHGRGPRPVGMREPGRDDRAAASLENVFDPFDKAPMQGDFLSVMEQNTAKLAAAF